MVQILGNHWRIIRKGGGTSATLAGIQHYQGNLEGTEVLKDQRRIMWEGGHSSAVLEGENNSGNSTG